MGTLPADKSPIIWRPDTAEDIAGGGGELDVHVIEGLVDAVGHPRIGDESENVILEAMVPIGDFPMVWHTMKQYA